jgi:pyruvate formate-lyase activating enzyme-like uncharacterized protein
MVLFITGICDAGCFYCPVSDERKGKDVVFANEMRVSSPDDIIKEAESMDATGTGITGGDPLVVIDRTLDAIRLLKERFGRDHHIHLYTAKPDPEKVRLLEAAGLDEIRFHIPTERWDSPPEDLLKEIVKSTRMSVGLEVPSIPGREKSLDRLISAAERAGVDFVNMNELEFSEGNWGMMSSHGFEIKNDVSASILGSEETALAVMKNHRRMRMHFCSSVFKDGVQLRNRLTRRAVHVAQEYDAVTSDGTILRGLVYADDPEKAASLLADRFGVPRNMMRADKEGGFLETASWILEGIASELPYRCFIVEEYPTADRLEVERTPLN